MNFRIEKVNWNKWNWNKLLDNSLILRLCLEILLARKKPKLFELFKILFNPI